MRILVMSDTHGSVDLAQRAVELARPVDQVIHLGDFRHDALELARRITAPVHAVRGDNDPWEGEKEVLIECSGHRLFATHGHYYDIDSSVQNLVKAATMKGAKAALFGHDHKPGIRTVNGILLVNPGSLFFAEKNKTFALLRISKNSIKAEIHGIQTHE